MTLWVLTRPYINSETPSHLWNHLIGLFTSWATREALFGREFTKKILKFSTGKGLELMFRASAPWKYMTRRERGGGVSGEIASKKTEQSTAGSCKWWRVQSWNSATVVARDSYYAVTFHDQSTDAPLSQGLSPSFSARLHHSLSKSCRVPALNKTDVLEGGWHTCCGITLL